MIAMLVRQKASLNVGCHLRSHGMDYLSER